MIFISKYFNMGIWKINKKGSIDTGGATISDNGLAYFPPNTAFTDIVYTVSYQEDYNCPTFSTDHTVRGVGNKGVYFYFMPQPTKVPFTGGNLTIDFYVIDNGRVNNANMVLNTGETTMNITQTASGRMQRKYRVLGNQDNVTKEASFNLSYQGKSETYVIEQEKEPVIEIKADYSPSTVPYSGGTLNITAYAIVDGVQKNATIGMITATTMDLTLISSSQTVSRTVNVYKVGVNRDSTEEKYGRFEISYKHKSRFLEIEQEKGPVVSLHLDREPFSLSYDSGSLQVTAYAMVNGVKKRANVKLVETTISFTNATTSETPTSTTVDYRVAPNEETKFKKATFEVSYEAFSTTYDVTQAAAPPTQIVLYAQPRIVPSSGSSYPSLVEITYYGLIRGVRKNATLSYLEGGDMEICGLTSRTESILVLCAQENTSTTERKKAYFRATCENMSKDFTLEQYERDYTELFYTVSPSKVSYSGETLVITAYAVIEGTRKSYVGFSLISSATTMNVVSSRIDETDDETIATYVIGENQDALPKKATFQVYYNSKEEYFEVEQEEAPAFPVYATPSVISSGGTSLKLRYDDECSVSIDDERTTVTGLVAVAGGPNFTNYLLDKNSSNVERVAAFIITRSSDGVRMRFSVKQEAGPIPEHIKTNPQNITVIPKNGIATISVIFSRNGATNITSEINVPSNWESVYTVPPTSYYYSVHSNTSGKEVFASFKFSYKYQSQWYVEELYIKQEC